MDGKNVPSCSGVVFLLTLNKEYVDVSFYLCHLFSVRFWIQRRFGEKNRMFFRGHSKFIVERVMPNLQKTMINGMKNEGNVVHKAINKVSAYTFMILLDLVDGCGICRWSKSFV